MKRILSKIAALLSIVVVFNLVGVSIVSANPSIGNSASNHSNYYSDELDRIYEDYLLNEKPYLINFENSSETSSEIESRFAVPIIKKFIEYTVKELLKKGTSVAVKATARNVAVNLTKQAIEEALKDGITTLMIDNLLSEKASGMQAIQKYYDMKFGSRVIYDPTNKLVAILASDNNDVITIYNDTGKNTIDFRV